MRYIKLFESFNKADLSIDQTFYTGRNTELDVFTLDYLNKENTNEHGPGIYLTNDINDAKGYGKFIHVVKLNPIGEIIKGGDSVKPVDASKAKKMIKAFASDWKMEAQNWAEDPNRGLNDFINSIVESATDRIDFYEYVWGGFFRDEPKQFAMAMTANGIDAIILAAYNKTAGITHVIAYNTDILKIQDIISLNN